MRSIFFILILIFSCSSKKDILLIQDSKSLDSFDIKFEQIKIKTDDILRIKISSQSPEISKLFSFNDLSPANSLEIIQIDGYQVNPDGYINIPSLKPIFVKGLTIQQVSNLIQQILREQEDLKNATVDVKIINSYFTVIGEVNRPGRYNFLKNNIDIFHALGTAGDLTINGERDNIKILRKNNGKMKVISLDLTSTDFILSEKFQIFPDDVIIVNPNSARVKNAGVIGNSGNLLSVLSFILSSIILVTQIN